MKTIKRYLVFVNTALISVALFMTAIIIGCASSVVYRVNPSSPPKMTQGEALEAMELSLSMMDQKSSGMNQIQVTPGEILYFPVNVTGSHFVSMGGNANRIDYDSVRPEVFKTGDGYSVTAISKSYSGGRYLTFSWNSEADARSFVDAAYVLSGRSASNRIKSTAEPVTARVEPKPSVITPPKTAPKSPVSVTPSKAPPRITITITSPDVTRADAIVDKRSSVTVTGIAESLLGIMDVFVNDQQADLDEKGRFSMDVPLRIGSNEIVVTAMDLKRNQETRKFIINREAKKTVVAKAPERTPIRGLQSSRYYALFIAVQDYTNPAIGRLDGPVGDARRVMDVLASGYTFNRQDMQFLQDPDRRTIYKTLQGLRHQLTERDNLLIFYAGHGVWVEDMKQGFWLPRDAAGPTDPSDWIPNSSVRDYIKAIKARHILLISDACFSGGILKIREPFVDPRFSVEKIYELPSRKAITSGSLKTVPDRSVFVEYLVKRLQENREPYLDAQKLFASLRDAVIYNSPTSQTPLYGAISEAGDEGGDFIFVRKP